MCSQLFVEECVEDTHVLYFKLVVFSYHFVRIQKTNEQTPVLFLSFK